MKSNHAIGILAEHLRYHQYPSSYLEELRRHLQLDYTSQQLTTVQQSLLQQCLYLLTKQAPVEYIVGSALFNNQRFLVTREVLIPRFDTEKLFHDSLQTIQKLPQPSAIIDIGTGSGILAICLAKSVSPLHSLHAVDISSAALALAQLNAQKHSVTDRITFHLADTYPLSSKTNSPLIPHEDTLVIVSNPPYLRNTINHSLPTSVTVYEPSVALFESLNFITKLHYYLTTLLQNNKTIFVHLEYANEDNTVVFLTLSGQEAVNFLNDRMSSLSSPAS